MRRITTGRAACAVWSVLVVSAQGQAPSDDCIDATSITIPALLQFDTSSATADEFILCRVNGSTVSQNGVWYEVSVPEPQLITMVFEVEDSATPYTGVVSILSGSCGGMSSGSCAWLDSGSGPQQYQFYMRAGLSYKILVASLGQVPVGGQMRLELTGELVVAESCADTDAIISGTTQVFFDTSAAAAGSPAGVCNDPLATQMQNDLWYLLKPPYPAMVEVLVDHDTVVNYDGMVQVYTGVCGATLTPLACSDEPEPSRLMFMSHPAENYRIQIGDWGLSPGGGPTQMDVLLTPMAGNFPEQAGPVAFDSTLFFDSTQATADGPPGSCNEPGTTTMERSVWAEHVAEQTGRVRVVVGDQSGYDQIVSVHSGVLWTQGGTYGDLTEIACSRGVNPASFLVDVERGASYWIQVGDAGPTPTGGVGFIRILEPCPADINGDGAANFADVQAFVQAFVGMSALADINGDGAVNFADVQAFVTAFNAGC